MKFQIQWFLAGLCGLASQLPTGEAFVASRSLRHVSSPATQVASQEAAATSRLQAMLLILEQDDGDDDDDDETKKSNAQAGANAGGSMGRAGGLPPQQQMRITIEGDLNEAFSAAMGARGPVPLPIAEWKQQLASTPPPPLTSGGKARLEKEIALLGRLAEGDEAAHELSIMWQHARGPKAAKLLKVAESLMTMGHPIAWRQAEEVLVKLVQEEGLHFTEPLNHLATLMFMQGRLEESQELCEMVLSQKPWHMGALLGIHTVCRKLDDYQGLVKWDQEIMPQIRDSAEKRKQWVKRMVPKAQDYLQRAEARLQSYFNDYGDDSSELLGSEGSIILENEHSEAWQ